jgi:protocatechuate 3,4-dioxygenase beta subunit
MRPLAVFVVVFVLACAAAGLVWCFAPNPRPAAPDAGAAAPSPATAALAGASDRGAAAAGAARPDGAIAGATPAREAVDSPALVGTVTDATGAAVAGARVTAERSEAEGYPLLDRERRAVRERVAEATTDVLGAFELRLAPGQPHLVRVAADGFAPAVRFGCQSPARADFRLDREAALAGTVHDEAGLPVPGTRIAVRQRVALGSWRVGETATDARGDYRIDGLPAGEALVDVEPQTLAWPRDAEVLLHAGATTQHDVVLLAGVTLRGSVRDAATRAAVADAEVGEGIAGRTVRTAADGTFALVGFELHNDNALRVRADGYPAREVMLRAPHLQRDLGKPIEILLARGYTVHGRVVDTRGTPLANVYVAGAAADMRAEGDCFRSDWCSATSAADGTFAVGPLRADMDHEVMLLRTGLATTLYALPPRATDATAVEVGDLCMGPPSSLRGVVVDERGEPVPGREVDLAGHNADRWRFTRKPDDDFRALDGYAATRRAQTDDRGWFHFTDLAAGEYTASTAQFDSHDQVRATASVPANGEATAVTLKLYRGMGIAGRVFVSDGGNLPKVYCSIDPEDGQATSGDVEVAADGSLRAGGLAAGNYTLKIYPYATDNDRAVGRSFTSVETPHVAAGSQAVRIELVVHGAVTGTVVDAAQAPVAGACVLVRDGARDVAVATSDAQGRFELTAPVQHPLRVFVLPRAPAENAAADVATALVSAPTTAGALPLLLVLPSR